MPRSWKSWFTHRNTHSSLHRYRHLPTTNTETQTDDQNPILDSGRHHTVFELDKLETELKFDLKGFSDFCPDVFSVTDDPDHPANTETIKDKMKYIPVTTLESPVHKFNVGESYSNWVMVADFRSGEADGDSTFPQPSLSLHLKLVKSYDRSRANLNDDKISVPVFTKTKISLIDSNGAVVLEGTTRISLYDKNNSKGWERAIGLDHIWSNKAKYFPDDVLRIRVDLTILASEGKASGEKTNVHVLPIKGLAQDLSGLLVSGEAADVTVNCGGNVFRVHRTILSARNEVFSNMFKSGLSEASSNSIKIEDIQPGIFQLLLDYISAASLLTIPALDQDQLVGLVQAGDKYQLDDLKEQCFRELVLRLNASNAGHIAVLCYLHSASAGDSIAVFKYCSRNWMTLAVQPAFQELVKGYPAAFFGPPNLN